MPPEVCHDQGDGQPHEGEGPVALPVRGAVAALAEAGQDEDEDAGHEDVGDDEADGVAQGPRGRGDRPGDQGDHHRGPASRADEGGEADHKRQEGHHKRPALGAAGGAGAARTEAGLRGGWRVHG